MSEVERLHNELWSRRVESGSLDGPKIDVGRDVLLRLLAEDQAGVYMYREFINSRPKYFFEGIEVVVDPNLGDRDIRVT